MAEPSSCQGSHPQCVFAADSVRKKSKKVAAGRSLPLEQAAEADLGVGPVFVGAGAREADDLGGFLDRQAREVAQLDEPGRLEVLVGQAGQGVMNGEDLVIRRGVADVR